MHQGNNLNLIQAIGRLENVMKGMRSPVLNQTNSTTNDFEASDLDNGNLAKQIEQQQRNATYSLLKEVRKP